MKLNAEYKNDILTIDSTELGNEHWYIEYKWDDVYPWKLYEIPEYGGEANLYDRYEYLYEAFHAAKNILI